MAHQPSTGRIEIYGQMGLCDMGNGVTVSRAMPAALNGRMDNFEWTVFCDKLDAALEPAGKVKTVQLAMFGSAIAITVLIWIIGFVQVTSSWDEGESMAPFASFVVGFFLVMAAIVVVQVYAIVTTNRVKSDIRQICDEKSQAHADLSFHLRFDVHIWGRGSDASAKTVDYIEVNVSNDGRPINININQQNATAAAAPAAKYDPAPTATAFAAPDSSISRSPLQRLDDLEKIKAHLSEEEYERKRAEILSDV